MNRLQRFESKLEQMVSGVFARAFRSAVQPVEIASALQRECDNNAQVLSRQRRLVPNDFHVELSRADLVAMHDLGPALERDLVAQLQQHGESQGYVFPGPINIDFDGADDLTTGRFRIRSRNQAAVLDNDQRTRTRSHVATLEVNGTRHPLRAPGLVIGRGAEADLRISDPGVSRTHLDLVIEGERVYAVDMDSTNGILVDGHRVRRAELRDGSTIKIGHTEMVLRMDEGVGR